MVRSVCSPASRSACVTSRSGGDREVGHDGDAEEARQYRAGPFEQRAQCDRRTQGRLKACGHGDDGTTVKPVTGTEDNPVMDLRPELLPPVGQERIAVLSREIDRICGLLDGRSPDLEAAASAIAESNAATGHSYTARDLVH